MLANAIASPSSPRPEKIDRSYLCRVLRLTLLAPEIVEAIMKERQPEEVTRPALMKADPEEWEKQAGRATWAASKTDPLLQPEIW